MVKRSELIWGLLGIAGILLMTDLFIRGGRIVPPSFTDYMEGVGRVRRAGMDFVMFGEGFTIGEFNQGRYLGPYYKPEKKPDSFRIALLGDSYVEGFQVFDRHHFRSILEDELSNRSGRKTEVLNFGRSGFDLEDMVAYSYTLVDKYEPDLMIYFLSRDDFQCSVTDQLIPKFEFSADSFHLSIPASVEYKERFKKYKDLPYYSTFLNMFSNCLKQHRRGLTAQKLLGKFYRNGSGIRSDGVAVTSSEIELDLARISTLLGLAGTNSNLIIINPDTINYPSEIQTIIDENSIPLIPLVFPIDSLLSYGINPYYWSVTNQYGHWNHKAHEAIGRYLAEAIEQKIGNTFLLALPEIPDQ